MSKKQDYIVLDARAMHDMDDATVFGFARSLEEAREICHSNGEGVIYHNSLPNLNEGDFVEYVPAQ